MCICHCLKLAYISCCGILYFYYPPRNSMGDRIQCDSGGMHCKLRKYISVAPLRMDMTLFLTPGRMPWYLQQSLINATLQLPVSYKLPFSHIHRNGRVPVLCLPNGLPLPVFS